MLSLTVLLVATASATTYNVRFCAEYSIDFDDANAIGDDYFIANTDRPARGALVLIQRVSDNEEIFLSYTPWDGTYAGCTPILPLSSDSTYRVSVYSSALVNGNTINVLDNDSTDDLYAFVEFTAYTPWANGTVWFDTSVQPQWNIAAAAGWAMYRRPIGLTGESFDLYTQACDSGGSCRDGNSTKISTGGSNRKYIIAHEFGHLVAYRKNGNVGPSSSYGASPSNCYTDLDQDHEAVSMEYQGAAASEGFAHYYAAVAFNLTTEYDCMFSYYKPVDWDRDADLDEGDASCEVEPYSGVGGADYLGSWCSGYLVNRGTEWDWLRFLWDLDTDEGVATTTIFDIYVSSDPDSWTATGSGSGGSYPAARLRSAASTEGVLTEWDDWDNYNGVHR